MHVPKIQKIRRGPVRGYAVLRKLFQCRNQGFVRQRCARHGRVRLWRLPVNGRSLPKHFPFKRIRFRLPVVSRPFDCAAFFIPYLAKILHTLGLGAFVGAPQNIIDSVARAVTNQPFQRVGRYF